MNEGVFVYFCLFWKREKEFKWKIIISRHTLMKHINEKGKKILLNKEKASEWIDSKVIMRLSLEGQKVYSNVLNNRIDFLFGIRRKFKQENVRLGNK